MSRTLFMQASVRLLVLSAAAAVLLLTGTSAEAQRRPEGARGRPQPLQPDDAAGADRNSPLLDSTGEPLEKLQPKTKPDPGLLDATAWYMTGQLREQRNDAGGALDAYRKAIEIDPGILAVYRALVPLSFQLNQFDRGIEYGMKAAELDAEKSHQWFRQLSSLLVARRRIPQAVELLEKAREADSLGKGTVDYVMIHRDLALLNGALGRTEKSADGYEVVFDALIHPEKYQLDAQQRRRLEEDNLTNYERIGQVFLEAERIELAVQAFEQAEKAGQGQPGTLGYNFAQVYARTGKHEKALEQIQKYFDAQLQSKGREAYQLLAEILESLDRSDELIGRLEEMAAKDRRNTLLQLYLADEYLKNDKLEQAEKAYQLAVTSGNSQGHIGLAGVYRRQSKPKELLEALGNAVKGTRNAAQLEENLTLLEEEIGEIAKNGELLGALFLLGRESVQSDPPTLEFPASLILAHLAAAGEKPDEAIEFYRYALELAENRVDLVYEDFGQYLLDARRFTDAVTLFEEAVDNPAVGQRKPQYLYRLSQAHELSGDTESALETLEEARTQLKQRGAENVPLLDYHEAWIYYHARRWDDAVAAFEKYIKTYPQDAEMVRRCRSILSAIFVQKGDLSKGEKILEEMLADDPDDPSVNNDLGYLYADQGKNLEKAEKMIRKAIEAQPENAAYLDSMGWVLYKLDRPEEALEYLEKAASLPDGEDSTILDHLADCYHEVGKKDKAVETWKKALEHERKQTHPDEKIVEKIEKKLNENEERMED